MSLVSLINDQIKVSDHQDLAVGNDLSETIEGLSVEVAEGTDRSYRR